MAWSLLHSEKKPLNNVYAPTRQTKTHKPIKSLGVYMSALGKRIQDKEFKVQR